MATNSTEVATVLGGTPPTPTAGNGAPAGEVQKPVEGTPPPADALAGGGAQPDVAALKADEKAQADSKPDAEAKAEELALTFPEGVVPDEALLGKFRPLAAELGLKSEGAQKLVNLLIERDAAQATAKEAAMAEVLKGWGEALKADADIGGAKFEATKATAQKAVARFGTPALVAWFESTGVGNHPELVRAFAKIGKAISEDSVAGATGAQSSAVDPDAALRATYPTMFRNKES